MNRRKLLLSSGSLFVTATVLLVVATTWIPMSQFLGPVSFETTETDAFTLEFVPVYPINDPTYLLRRYCPYTLIIIVVYNCWGINARMHLQISGSDLPEGSVSVWMDAAPKLDELDVDADTEMLLEVFGTSGGDILEGYSEEYVWPDSVGLPITMYYELKFTINANYPTSGVIHFWAQMEGET
jgi:hypothetical protein